MVYLLHVNTTLEMFPVMKYSTVKIDLNALPVNLLMLMISLFYVNEPVIVHVLIATLDLQQPVFMYFTNYFMGFCGSKW